MTPAIGEQEKTVSATTSCEEASCVCKQQSRLHTPASSAKAVALTELAAGQKGRIVRVNVADLGCKRRFAELGLMPGMTLTVVSTGETMMLELAGGKFGLAARCAGEIMVITAK